ncbi:DUF2591 domain-containing protein [bacterium]|jgi:hypothetical protein|nr:DUF2591 domain-containing protein [bacterium]
MKVQVSEAEREVLDWMVAKCEGKEMRAWRTYVRLNQVNYSTDWAQGGPIIERECIDVMFEGPEWYAYMRWEDKTLQHDGPTPLIAAMRCYVASKLGDEVDVPDELAPKK